MTITTSSNSSRIFMRQQSVSKQNSVLIQNRKTFEIGTRNCPIIVSHFEVFEVGGGKSNFER